MMVLTTMEMIVKNTRILQLLLIMMFHITVCKYHVNNSDNWQRYAYCEDDDEVDRNDDDDNGPYDNRGSSRPDDDSDFRRSHVNDDKSNADCCY